MPNSLDTLIITLKCTAAYLVIYIFLIDFHLVVHAVWWLPDDWLNFCPVLVTPQVTGITAKSECILKLDMNMELNIFCCNKSSINITISWTANTPHRLSLCLYYLSLKWLCSASFLLVLVLPSHPVDAPVVSSCQYKGPGSRPLLFAVLQCSSTGKTTAQTCRSQSTKRDNCPKPTSG